MEWFTAMNGGASAPLHIAFGCPCAGVRGSQVSFGLLPGCLESLGIRGAGGYETANRAGGEER